MIVALLAAFVGYLLWRLSKIEGKIETLDLRVSRLDSANREKGPAVAPSRPLSPSILGPRAPRATEPQPSRAMPIEIAPPARGESIEQQIGARWLLYIGVVAIVVGAAFFEKLAMDSGWISAAARVVEGVAIGFALVIAGFVFERRGYVVYGQMVCGGGLAILYLCTYAAYNLYGLQGHTAAFAEMAAITALGASLADRQRSSGLAVLAVVGGFATPFLLRSAIDAYIALFVFDATLIAGASYLAARRDWPLLNAVSYVATALSLSTWASQFYEPSKYLWTEVFLTIYCAMFADALRRLRRRDHGPVSLPQGILRTAPLVYYVASLAILFDHAAALLVFLCALAVTGAMIARRAGAVVRLASWFAALIPLLGWANGPAGQESIGAGLAAATAIYCTFLAAQVASVHRRAAPVHPADLLLFHANALGSFAVAYSLLELTQRGATGWLALAFATWHGGLGLAAVQRQRDDSIHAAALAFTLLTISVSLLLSGPWMTVAWAAEGGAAIALGLREKRTWFRIAGGLLLAVAIGRLLGLLFSTPRLTQPLLFNRRVAVAVFVIALTYALAWLHDRAGDADHWMEVAAAVVLAQVLTVALVTSEIVAYWRVHDVGRPAALAEGLMISVAWAAYAAGLIVVGIARRYAPIRYAAFMLFGITIAKVFAVDLPTLDRIYRVSSVIALGIALLSVAYGYQRFRVELPADDVK